jgi:AcrR family transcriptional regulator
VKTVGRAQPLAADERRAMIIDAVIPLLLLDGRAVTSKQIAEAAGIAEGTIFRVFKDKDSLIDAAASRYLEVDRLRRDIRAIDPTLTLEATVQRMLELMLDRFSGMFRMMAIVGWDNPHRGEVDRREFTAIIETVLAPHLDELDWSPEKVAHILRLVAFSAALPQLNQGSEFSLDELTAFVLHGIGRTGRPER